VETVLTFLGIIAGIMGTVASGFMVYKREITKIKAEREVELTRVNEVLFEELSKQTSAVQTRVDEELSGMRERNDDLVDKIDGMTKEVDVLKVNFIALSRQYAVTRARVDELSKIALRLIDQIEEDGNEPLYTKTAVADMVADAGSMQDEICVACLTNILTGGTMNEDEVMNTIRATSPKTLIGDNT